MTDTHDSDAVPCRDIDPAELFEQGLSPEVYHDLREVTQEVISDRSGGKIVFIEEQCSRCSTRIPGIGIFGNVPESMQTIKSIIYEVYEAFYQNPRDAQYVSMGQQMVELGHEAVTELFKSLLLAAGLGHKDAENATGKRSKPEVWAQILGSEFAGAD